MLRIRQLIGRAIPRNKVTAFRSGLCPTTRTPAKHSHPGNEEPELLMVGISAKTFRIGNKVSKVLRLDEEEAITAQNIKATCNEASIYILLGDHPRVAKCLYVGPEKSYIELEYYTNGTLKRYVDQHRANITDIFLKRWARQMIEGTVFIHAMGVRHSDIRLSQWLLDADLDARLSDFNGSGYDGQTALGLDGSKALGNESPSHYMPRDPAADSTFESDVFALGSALYELVAGQMPYEGFGPELIETLFRQQSFPSVERLLIGDIIMGCWKRELRSAEEVLDYGEKVGGL